MIFITRCRGGPAGSSQLTGNLERFAGGGRLPPDQDPRAVDLEGSSLSSMGGLGLRICALSSILVGILLCRESAWPACMRTVVREVRRLWLSDLSGRVDESQWSRLTCTYFGGVLCARWHAFLPASPTGIQRWL